MAKDRYSKTERIGVNKVESIFLEKFDWIFREQVILDMGIDAHIELVKDKEPTGILSAIQIKTGLSNFYETEDNYTFYINKTHYKYWINHSLPVFLIGHIPEQEKTVWQFIDDSTVEETKQGWKTVIPKSNDLEDHHSIFRIQNILESKTLNGKITKLYLDLVLMKHISEGGKVVLYTQEWHNKSLGRGPFKIIIIDDKGEEKIHKEWRWYYTYEFVDLIEKTFPWAEIGIDEDFYEINFDDSFYDVYTDRFIQNNKIYPYSVYSGEISLYRIQLKLNKIGKAFLELEEYLSR